MRYGKWKLHQYFEDGAVELYNLDTDVSEQDNLAQFNPDKTLELIKMLEKWRFDTSAPIPDQLNPKYIITK